MRAVRKRSAMPTARPARRLSPMCSATRPTTWLDSRGQTAMVEDALGNRSRMIYDAAAIWRAVIGPTGLTASFTYDAVGNLIATRDPMGYETTFGYGGPHNNLTLVRDARGNALRYSYDDAGNPSRITYEDGSHEDFLYDGAGNLLVWTNRRGETITYTLQPPRPGNRQECSRHARSGRLSVYLRHGRQPDLGHRSRGHDGLHYDPQTNVCCGSTIRHRRQADLPGLRVRRRRPPHQEHRPGRARAQLLVRRAGRLDRMTDAAGELVVDYEYDAAGTAGPQNAGQRRLYHLRIRRRRPTCQPGQPPARRHGSFPLRLHLRRPGPPRGHGHPLRQVDLSVRRHRPAHPRRARLDRSRRR
jgi:YD repeat-containing protein